ncbi:MAG: SDR family oxidoreductase [Bacteroidetes bacterium]|nr:SDR family oxidoreductase [Bacteroidota bacterium]
MKSVDILINNAGFLRNIAFAETNSDTAERTFNINFFVPAQLIRLLLPLMGKNSRSHIVNISSMGGVQGSAKFPGLAYYSASKAALACLTECLAEEYKEHNIAFNCLALGAAQTEMLEEAFPGYKAPVTAKEMAVLVSDFAVKGQKYFNGKIIPVSGSTP